MTEDLSNTSATAEELAWASERVVAMREALLAWQRSVVADERDRPVGMRR